MSPHSDPSSQSCDHGCGHVHRVLQNGESVLPCGCGGCSCGYHGDVHRLHGGGGHGSHGAHGHSLHAWSIPHKKCETCVENQSGDCCSSSCGFPPACASLPRTRPWP